MPGAYIHELFHLRCWAVRLFRERVKRSLQIFHDERNRMKDLAILFHMAKKKPMSQLCSQIGGLTHYTFDKASAQIWSSSRIIASPEMLKLICLFVWDFKPLWRIFHSYGDINIISERLQIFTHTWQSWPLSSEPRYMHVWCVVSF